MRINKKFILNNKVYGREKVNFPEVLFSVDMLVNLKIVNEFTIMIS